MLSVTIITKNEEQHIKRCLESVNAVADEIIVVDSGSTDKTQEICNSFSKVRFYHQDWLGFSRQKQMAIEKAQFDMILSLDADEALSDELTKEILKKKEVGFFPLDAFELKRLTHYCGKWIYHCGWYPDWQLRLFHREHCRWKSVPVHEHVICDSGVQLKRFENDIHHYSFNDLSDHVKRIDYYSSLGAEKIIQKSHRFLVFKGLVHGFARFFKTYITQRGFLDGYHGFCISMLSSWAVFLKYAKAKEKLLKEK
jgi:glycosyltransferase involved in cell wall biosynthesis